MPIYEYYCPDNHTIYQFYAKTLAQGRVIPPCPDNPAFRLQKQVSAFAVTRSGKDEPPAAPDASDDPADSIDDSRMAAAMGAMEKEFGQVDENDPKAMGRMMRRMAELTGEKLKGDLEEVVRKLEEGADPDSLEEQFGGSDETPDDGEGEGGLPPGADRAKPQHRLRMRRLASPRRDPQLYDYP